MSRLKTYFLVALAAIVLMVVFQNTDAVETRILFMRVTMPRVLLLLVTFVMGLLFGYLLALRRVHAKTAKKKSV